MNINNQSDFLQEVSGEREERFCDQTQPSLVRQLMTRWIEIA
jgi:hypothetical protein